MIVISKRGREKNESLMKRKLIVRLTFAQKASDLSRQVVERQVSRPAKQLQLVTEGGAKVARREIVAQSVVGRRVAAFLGAVDIRRGRNDHRRHVRGRQGRPARLANGRRWRGGRRLGQVASLQGSG